VSYDYINPLPHPITTLCCPAPSTARYSKARPCPTTAPLTSLHRGCHSSYTATTPTTPDHNSLLPCPTTAQLATAQQGPAPPLPPLLVNVLLVLVLQSNFALLVQVLDKSASEDNAVSFVYLGWNHIRFGASLCPPHLSCQAVAVGSVCVEAQRLGAWEYGG
jgi:hypothetical protein